jgi:hypothetical protein
MGELTEWFSPARGHLGSTKSVNTQREHYVIEAELIRLLTLICVIAIVHIALVIIALSIVGREPFRAYWYGSIRRVAYVCVFPAVIIVYFAAGLVCLSKRR